MVWVEGRRHLQMIISSSPLSVNAAPISSYFVGESCRREKLMDQQSWLYFNKAIQPSASMMSLTSLNQYVPTCEFLSRETQAVHVINVFVDQERVGLSSLRLVCLTQLQFCLKNGS